jgi:hypothetical protein
MLVSGLGLGTCFQALPSQWMIRVLSPVEPTAQALRADVAATPWKAPPGLGTRVQVLPFQWTISVLPVPVPVEPTAQAFVAEMAAAPLSSPLVLNDAAGPGDPVRAAAAARGATPLATPATRNKTPGRPVSPGRQQRWSIDAAGAAAMSHRCRLQTGAGGCGRVRAGAGGCGRVRAGGGRAGGAAEEGNGACGA